MTTDRDPARSDSVAQGPLESSPQAAQKVDFAMKARLKSASIQSALHCRIPQPRGSQLRLWGGGGLKGVFNGIRGLSSLKHQPLSLFEEQEKSEKEML